MPTTPTPSAPKPSLQSGAAKPATASPTTGARPPAPTKPAPKPSGPNKPAASESEHPAEEPKEEKEAEEEEKQEDQDPQYDANFWDELYNMASPPQPTDSSRAPSGDNQTFIIILAQQLQHSGHEYQQTEQQSIKNFCDHQKQNQTSSPSNQPVDQKDTTEFINYLKQQDTQNNNSKYSDAINKLNPDNESKATPQEKAQAYKTLKQGMDSYIKDNILKEDGPKSTLEKLQGNESKLQQLAKIDKEMKEGMKNPGNKEKQGIFSKLAEQMKNPSLVMQEGPKKDATTKERQNKKEADKNSINRPSTAPPKLTRTKGPGH